MKKPVNPGQVTHDNVAGKVTVAVNENNEEVASGDKGIAKRLELLRSEMREMNIDIYIIPSIDAHNSEYVPACWERRAWISNFNGSAGEVIVTLDHAYLWTDGRYFLQAEQQLNPACFQLMKQQGFVSETEQ